MLRCKNVMRLMQVPLQRAYVTGSSPSGSSKRTEENNRVDEEDKHPIRRTLRLLGNDMRKIKEFFVPKEQKYEDLPTEIQRKLTSSKQNGGNGASNEFQTHCDVVIIGGGGVGSSIAYWLKQKARDGLNVVVVEKDDTYSRSATHVSVGGLSQQFSLPENIEMSLFGAEFIRNAGEIFGTDIPLHFTPLGNLVLAGDADAEMLKQTSQLQNELGARNVLLTAERLAAKFPWLNTKGVALGCIGLEREGWFDSWALLTNLKRAAIGFGAHYVHGEVIDYIFQDQSDIVVTGQDKGRSYESVDKVVVQMPDGAHRTIKFALCIIAAGVNSGEVAQLAHIGKADGMLRFPLPIGARKRYMYTIDTKSANVPGMVMPMIVDSTGIFLYRNSVDGFYTCGQNVMSGSNDNLDVDSAFFESNIRPALIERVPAFKTAKVVNSTAGFLDYNMFDDNGILGAHPYYHNLYIASGFSGQGMQQAPAVGRAISELIMDGQFRTLDLSRLSFDRLIVDKPMYEFNALH